MSPRGNPTFILLAAAFFITMFGVTTAAPTTESTAVSLGLGPLLTSVLNQILPLIINLLNGTDSTLSDVVQDVIKILVIVRDSGLLSSM